uniref:OSJNBa0057M08.2 protein n=1 Tax=Oryza sativa subsp. japonica TaxID=39947 RepID=Q7F8W0_ORYSJ|nr:OSJNBa0057M08.2 [Oryza sativa Japonica Group]
MSWHRAGVLLLGAQSCLPVPGVPAVEGFTTVNLANNAYKDELFVLAKQVVQVFYIVDPCNKKLHVVREGKRRIVGLDNIADEDDYNQHVHGIGQEIPLEEEEEEDEVQYARVDHEQGLFL